MILQTDKNLKVLNHKSKIPKTAKCYGKRVDGTIGWGNPSQLVGSTWNRYSINSPSIILVPA